MSSHAGLSSRPLDPVVTLPSPRLRALAPYVLGAGLAAVALVAKGGTELKSATSTAIGVTLVGAAIAIAAVLVAPTPRRRWGAVSLALLTGLAAWTALSIYWSITPADSWVEANRTVSYVAAFGGAIAVARLAPERGRGIITAVLVGCLVVCLIALFDKAFPAASNSTASLARLREPLGYWNALGLLAAMAAPGALWLGARRDGTPAGRAFGYPLLALVLITLLFAYSRGALVAMAIGLAYWFAVVPLRMRGLVVLLIAGAGSAVVTAWAFSQDALSKDRQPLAERISAGQELAVLMILLGVLLFAAGLGVQWLAANRPPGPRLRRSLALATLAAVLLAPAAGLAALAASERGLAGTVSQAWDSFFGTSAAAPSYGPDRLTATGSKRGAYWDEAYQIWERTPVEGAGAGSYGTARLRYRDDAVDVRHAHGYVPQTAADLGLVGLGLSVAFLLAWAIAARRSTARPTAGPWEPGEAVWRRPSAWPAAAGARLQALNPVRLPGRARAGLLRVGQPGAPPSPVEAGRLELLTLIAVVVTFLAHSAIDWTWAFPGTAVVALVAAGYVAGHGPPAVPAARRSAPISTRAAVAAAITVLALAAAWMIWQPQRAQSATESSAALLIDKRVGDARLLAQSAAQRNPVSAEPLHQWAAVEAAARHPTMASALMERAVRMQPLNPDTWRAMGQFELNRLNNPSKAFTALRVAVGLDPKNPQLRQAYTDAFRRLPRGGARAKPATGGQGKPAPRAGGGKPGGTPAASPSAAVTRCREIVRKLQQQLGAGGLSAEKAAKKRARLARCQATIRRAGG